MKFPRPIFEKYSNTKFHFKKPFSGSRVVPSGETDRQLERQIDRNNEANIRFSQFYERAYKPPIPKTNAATGANSVWGRIDEIFNDAMILTNKCHFTRLVLYVDSFRYQYSTVRFKFFSIKIVSAKHPSYNGNFSFVQRLRLSLIHIPTLV
jgi:hypothetical protein